MKQNQRILASISVVLLSVYGLVGCSKGKCGACGKDADFGSGLACHPVSHVCKGPGDDSMSCPADCKVSDDCNAWGKCTLEGGKCVIGSNDDCRLHGPCLNGGECTMKKEAYGPRTPTNCVGTSDADCKKSLHCRILGHCSFNAAEPPFSPDCAVMSDADCANSDLCKNEMKCKANNKYCVAATP